MDKLIFNINSIKNPQLKFTFILSLDYLTHRICFLIVSVAIKWNGLNGIDGIIWSCSSISSSIKKIHTAVIDGSENWRSLQINPVHNFTFILFIEQLVKMLCVALKWHLISITWKYFHMLIIMVMLSRLITCKQMTLMLQN